MHFRGISRGISVSMPGPGATLIALALIARAQARTTKEIDRNMVGMVEDKGCTCSSYSNGKIGCSRTNRVHARDQGTFKYRSGKQNPYAT